MAKLKMYVVHDSKAGLYNKPFYEVNNAVAMRGFEDAVRSGETNLSRYPQDYDLYLVGEFNEDTAEIKAVVPQHLCGARDYVAEKQASVQDLPNSIQEQAS
jgi:hypothetical protein